MTFETMAKRLGGLHRVYLDANIFIYLIEGDEELSGAVIELLEEADLLGVELVTCEVTLTECLIGAYKAQSEELAERYNTLISEVGIVTPLPLDRIVFQDAAKVAAAQRLKTVDALHFASAIHSGCDGFISNDRGFRSVPGLKVISL